MTTFIQENLAVDQFKPVKVFSATQEDISNVADILSEYILINGEMEIIGVANKSIHHNTAFVYVLPKTVYLEMMSKVKANKYNPIEVMRQLADHAELDMELFEWGVDDEYFLYFVAMNIDEANQLIDKLYNSL